MRQPFGTVPEVHATLHGCHLKREELKKSLRIIGKTLLALFVVLYVVVALANYSIVQSLAGSAASSWLSKDWGGKVHVGSMSVNLLTSVKLRDVQMITPSNDTVAVLGRVVARYNAKPIQPDGLHLKSVYISRGYFHLQDKEDGLTVTEFVKYLNKRFASKSHEEDTAGREHPFVVRIETVVVNRMHYKQTLRNPDEPRCATGINVPDMDFTNINFKCRNVRVEGDPRVTLRMERFSVEEASGFRVRNLRMNVYVAQDAISATNMELETDSTRLYCDVLMRYPGFGSMKDFCDSVVFDVDIKEGSSCNMRDAAYWTSTLWGMDEQITLQGQVHGPVADMRATRMIVAFGNATELDFDGYVRGLPHIDSTLFDVELHSARTDYADLHAIHWSDKVHVPVPALVRQFGRVNLSAAARGGIRDFTVGIDAATEPGHVVADVAMHYDSHTKDYHYTVGAQSPSFLLSRVVKNEWVSHTGFDLTAEGQGFDPKHMTAKAEAVLTHTVLRGEPLTTTHLTAEARDGVLTADVKVHDSTARIDLWAMADLRDSIGNYEVSCNVKQLDLARLHLWHHDGDSTACLSMQLQSRLYGSKIENMYGTVVLDNTRLTVDGREGQMKTASLSLRTVDDYKNIMLSSDIVNASVKGYFNYSDLPIAVAKFCADYVPRYYAKDSMPVSYDPLASMEMEFNLLWTDSLRQTAVLLPSLNIAPGTSLRGNYNFAEQLKMVMRSDSVTIGGMTFYDIGMNANQNGGRYAVDLNSQRLVAGGTTMMENVRLNGLSSTPEADLHLQWDNAAADTTRLSRGDIALRLSSSDTGNWLSVTQGNLYVSSNRWSITHGKPLFFSRKVLSMESLDVRCVDQSVLLKASRRHDSSDFAEMTFHDFRLQQLNPLLQQTGLTLGGILKGEVRVLGLNETPYFRANLNVDSTAVGGQQIGTTRVLSSWDPQKEHLNVYLTTALTKETGTTAPIMAEGVVDVSNPKAVGLDFGVLFDGFQLQTLQPLVKSAVSEMHGDLRGQFSIGGTLRQPVVTGVAYIDSGAVRVSQLNVCYTFNDSISLTNDEISFNHFALRDPNGNMAYVDGKIGHNYLHDFQVDLSLASPNIMLLNTTARQSAYYGTVFASVDGRMQGALDDFTVQVKARTQRGSHVVLPFNQQRSVQDVDYIQFVAPAYNAYDGAAPRRAKGGHKSKYAITAEVQITPEAQLQLPVDFSQVFADISAKGKGTMEVQLNSGSPLSIIGDYEIDNGTMDLTFLSLFTKGFTIEEGSSINFPGELNAAMFDIRALYSQRVNLSSLTGSLSTTNSQTNVQVENVIALSGSLVAPAISFDLRLPNADQALQDEVFSYIDRSSEKDMMNQTMSLLLLKQFYNANSAENTTTAGGTSMVANTVGSVVSDMIEFVNVNFDYRQGTELTTDQFEMDVSREWNKFYFEGTFGYGGEAREVSEVNNVNNLTGDMLMGYKFSPMLHGYVFNRSNTNDYTRSDLPYKQGMGIKFTRDYDRWVDVLRSNKKVQEKNIERQKKKAANTPASPPRGDSVRSSQ